MEQLNIILFCTGFIISTATLIFMLIKNIKGKKVGFVAPFLMIIGVVSLGCGVWLTIEQINSHSSAVVSNTNTNTVSSTKTNVTEASSTNAKTEDKKSQKEVVFDATGSVVPKSSMDMWGNETFLDADGSKSVEGVLFTPKGIRYRASSDGGTVGIPDDKVYQDGKHYKQYSYSINNLDGIVSVLQENIAIKDENDPNLNKDLGSKLEQYPANSGYEMKYIDFIYKYIPVSLPQNTVENEFLSGNYVAKQEKALETKTTMVINILDEKLLDFKCSYIAGMDSIYGYKIELLGKNAYKLYLYPVTIKADTNNGGGTTVSSEPSKRTFLIYMKSKDSFDIVFTSDDIRRTSISMNSNKL